MFVMIVNSVSIILFALWVILLFWIRLMFVISYILFIGWEVVSEYLTDELADNPDDDKRIRQAQSKVSQNLKRKKSNKFGPRKVLPRSRMESPANPDSSGSFFSWPCPAASSIL